MQKLTMRKASLVFSFKGGRVTLPVSSDICEYHAYSLVPDPQISRNCESSVIPRWQLHPPGVSNQHFLNFFFLS
jgi:hypothetical protein